MPEPSIADRFLARLRARVIAYLQRRRESKRLAFA